MQIGVSRDRGSDLQQSGPRPTLLSPRMRRPGRQHEVRDSSRERDLTHDLRAAKESRLTNAELHESRNPMFDLRASSIHALELFRPLPLSKSAKFFVLLADCHDAGADLGRRAL